MRYYFCVNIANFTAPNSKPNQMIHLPIRILAFNYKCYDKCSFLDNLSFKYIQLHLYVLALRWRTACWWKMTVRTIFHSDDIRPPSVYTKYPPQLIIHNVLIHNMQPIHRGLCSAFIGPMHLLLFNNKSFNPDKFNLDNKLVHGSVYKLV